MSRRSHLFLSLLFCFLLAISFFTPRTKSQSTLRSLSLNGTTASVDVPNHSTLNITGAITVEAWIKFNAIDSNNHDIVSRINRNDSTSGGGYSLTVNPAGKVRLDLFQNYNAYTTVIGATAMSTGAWHHVAGVFSGSQMRVYVDGVLDGSFNTTNAPGSGTSLLRIGKAAHPANTAPLFLPSYAFAGLIDEVRVSAAALYSGNFTAGLGSGSNVRGLWKFDGQTANDSSGTGNNGAVQNGATYSTDIPPAGLNNAPSVSLTHPLNNTSIAAGANIVMDATASDSDGSVTKVDFYQGTTLLGTDTTAPYTFVWTNVAAGSYSLSAKATDDATATTSSTTIAVTVAAGGNHSLSLNGTTASVDVPNHSTLNITGPITVEAWIKFNAIDGNNHDIVSRINRNDSTSGGGYSLTVNPAGKLRLDLFQNYNAYTTVIGATAMSTGAWHHVAGVFSGSQMRVYVDGVLDGSFNTTNAPGSGTSLLRIGKAAHPANTAPLFLPSYAFAGLIDEVRVSAAALYSSNFTPGLGSGSNVRGLWKFDGQTPNDFSGTGNNGTVQNGAEYSTDVPSTGGGGSQRPVPNANGPYSGQLAQAISFSSSGSVDPDGTITAYHWNFGDGTLATTANPSHTYTASGIYTATLTVTDNAGQLASAATTVTVGNGGNARLDPLNQTGGSGENPLSRNFNWTLPLVNLPGRAGMDLDLSLYYNSLVWTKLSSNYISFDDDHGFPSPGFRLGFPVIQPQYYNAEVGKYAFLLIGSDGSRTELRRFGTSALYEAADSSYLLLDSSNMTLRATDGTQLKYELKGSEYQCTEIKDRNGNYITVTYTPSGRIDTIVDTLARSIKFNYANGLLTSITQIWNETAENPPTHVWASFEYTNTPIQTNFPDLTVAGPSNGLEIKTLSKVTLTDGSYFEFSYTSWGQVWKVSSFGPDDNLLNYRSYDLPGSPLESTGPQVDCPRFTERRDWAENWNLNGSGIEQEALTTYTEPGPASWTMPDETAKSGTRAEVTTPDGTVNKIYFLGTTASEGWRRGLPALVETYSGGNWQRKVMTTWTQDDTTVSYPLNPRVLETNVYDPANNVARVETTYQQFTFGNGTSCQLPRDVYEYATDTTTKLRSTRTDYNTNSAYTGRRIIGLVSEKLIYDGDVNNGGVLKSKLGFFYDNENSASSIQNNDAPVQHDNANYSSSFVTGRANISSVRRYNVDNVTQFTTTTRKYNTAGSVVSTTDASGHVAQLSYVDSFSDSVSRNTLAYPTTLTDPDNYTTTTKYNFDFGATTFKQTPKPNVTTIEAGPSQTITYDQHGRVEQVTNEVNEAYIRYVYSNDRRTLETFTTIQDSLGEVRSLEFMDGAGRVIGSATEHPGSTGGYSGRRFTYDVMGRLVKSSNPTETSASGPAPGWTTAGDDEDSGWIYTEQTYDWKGRPLVTTKPSMTSNASETTTEQISYTGCGCAGGEIITLTDEVGRKRKIYTDVLGRTVKIETLNPNGSVYSTVAKTYNARDQVTNLRQYAGTDASTTYQDTTSAYDGYGRIQSQHLPEYSAGTSTTITYRADDTVEKITDARGASQTFTQNNRHLVTNVTYTVPAGSGITVPSPVSFVYDGAGNRKSMTDGLGTQSYQYDLLSQMTQETRQLSVGSFSINYSYNLGGQLAGVTDPFGASFSYTRNSQGQIKAITGSSYGGVTSYVTDVDYRAWGAAKSATFVSSNWTTAYNARQLPTQYRLTQNSTGTSIIRENYTYYGDGQIATLTDLDDTGGISPPSTLRFLSRAYSYDHVGRVINGHGTGTANQRVPFNQSYSYDTFDNMTSRAGAYYDYTSIVSVTDNGTYTNNRRSGWTYDANGELLATPASSTDQARTMTYDAAGNLLSVVETGSISTNYSATYDGDGQIVYESTSVSGTSDSGYAIRSTVLGGEVLTRLNSAGNKKVTHVPTMGFLVASQAGGPTPVVVVSHLNPFGTTASGKKVIDPLGNNIPFQGYGDPRPPAGSYTSASMSGLVASLANPHSYGNGCLLDGTPVNCSLAMRLLGNGSAGRCPENDCGPRVVDGKLSPIGLTEQGWVAWVQKKKNPPTLKTPPTRHEIAGRRKFRAERGLNPYGVGDNEQAQFDLGIIRTLVTNTLSTTDCRDFYRMVLQGVSSKENPVLENGDLEKIFERFMNEGSFTRDKPRDLAEPAHGSIDGRIGGKEPAKIYLNDTSWDRNFWDGYFTIGELFHLAGSKGFYTDQQLADVIHNQPNHTEFEKAINDEANIYSLNYKNAKIESPTSAYSYYFHTIQQKYCVTRRTAGFGEMH
ncbi:MAG TPA: LamG-like jellyroll fold domain-containing protein [Pyrinomonadaceae bacterium]|nr:LamG-like jellyroll fold domain-containing protein [Pyrinomonadaceae bacterium]